MSHLHLLAVLLLVAQEPPPPVQAPEPELKAEFIERFTRFVEWPPEALGGGSPHFVVCIVGPTPVARALTTTIGKRQLKGKPAQFRVLRARDDFTGCHALFIGAVSDDDVAVILAATAGRPILTVADSPGAGKRGAIFNFVPEGRRLRFEVNMDAAHSSALKISARLLQLARRLGE